jgi:hypothetical protein
LFRIVEPAIVISVVLGELGVHHADMRHHVLEAWLNSVRQVVRRQLQAAIGEGAREGFSFLRIELAILVRVKGRDLSEDLRDMLHSGGRISVVLYHVTPNPAAMDLGDCQAANGDTEQTCYYEYFDFFHKFLMSVISFPWHRQRLVAGQVA